MDKINETILIIKLAQNKVGEVGQGKQCCFEGLQGKTQVYLTVERYSRGWQAGKLDFYLKAMLL